MEDISDNELVFRKLYQVIKAASELGAVIALVKAGKIKPYLKKSDAFRLYGRVHVEHWILRGWIKCRKDGDHSAAWRLDRIELEVLSKAILLIPII
jgi:hypothetical protein